MYKRKTGEEIVAQNPALQPRMRSILMDWMIEVSEVYRLHRETFYLAVDFIDRYLSATRAMQKTRLQLIGTGEIYCSSPETGIITLFASHFHSRSHMFVHRIKD